MKNAYFLFFAMLLFGEFVPAQTSSVTNTWEITQSYEYGDKVRTRSTYITFKESGVIEASGMELGTWLRNELKNTLTIECPIFEVIEGVNTIEILDDKVLQLKNSKGQTIILKRMNLPKDKELHNKYTGEWLLEKAEKNGETEFVGMLMTLGSNGIFYTQGVMFGKWGYNSVSKKLVFDVSEKEDDFHGEHKVTEVSNASFILELEGARFHFIKMNPENIAIENAKSGLIGMWEFNAVPNDYTKTYVLFNAPDEFMIIEKQEGMESKRKGKWFFDKQKMSLLMMGLRSEDTFKGKNKVVSIDKEFIELDNEGQNFKGIKTPQSINKIERLVFTQEDFYSKEGDYKYYGEKEKLPWQDPLFMMMSMLDINQLVYNYATLINGTTAFETKLLTAEVKVNPQDMEFNVDNIFVGFDRNSIPEDFSFPSNTDYVNALYPLEGDTFRVVGKEKVTTPAGTFNCTVLEALVDSDVCMKLWMINDKLGVYAKIIEDKKQEHFGYYHIYELQEIK